VLDLNGPKYLILSLDDFNQNHVNNSLVSIAPTNNVLKVPSYFTADVPRTCLPPQSSRVPFGPDHSNLQELMTTNDNSGLVIAGKYEQDYTATPIALPSAPRTLTKAQLYTINEIQKNRNNLTNYLSRAPTASNVLAILPIKTSTGVPTGTMLVDFSGSLQDNKRTYFGPVDIDKMAVKLMDDKGNVLNLHGMDWCVTLICECLYQY
jgi:hypothetical protein